MSKSNPFASFADSAEPAETAPVVGPTSVEAANKRQLTVKELADFLNTLLKNNPALETARVFQAEGMRIFNAGGAEVDNNRLIITE